MREHPTHALSFVTAIVSYAAILLRIFITWRILI